MENKELSKNKYGIEYTKVGDFYLPNIALPKARRTGTAANVINNLVKYSCLVVVNIANMTMDRENTLLFAQLIGERYDRGKGGMIITCDKSPKEWTSFFSDNDALKGALDRLLDVSYCFSFAGESFRGK